MIQSLANPLAQMLSPQFGLSQGLAQYQQQLNHSDYQNVAIHQLLQSQQLMNAVPTETPEQRKAWQVSRAQSWASEGHDLLDRITFWLQFPIIGRLVARKIAERLDWVTDQIEGYADALQRQV